MQIILLLISVMALAYFSRPADKQSYQIAILAIIGFAYLFIWRFVDFYMTVFMFDDDIKDASFFVVMFITVAIGLLPVVRKITRTVSMVLAAIFVMSMLLTFSIEKEIKNYTVSLGGYFESKNIRLAELAQSDNLQAYSYEEGGFNINMPSRWTKKQLSSGLEFFELRDNNKLVAELRPRCFHNTDLSIAEIVSNAISWDKQKKRSVEHKCFISSDNLYHCFIRSESEKGSQIREIWRWMVMDEYQTQNVELDFVFYNDDSESRHQAEGIIHSLVFRALAKPLPLCVGSVDWF